MEQFTIKGSSLPHRIYSNILAYAQNKVRRYEDKVEVELPSECILCKQQEEGKAIDFNAEILIRENLKDAYKIG